jgi:hypothetical protein
MARPRRRHLLLGLFVIVATWALPGSGQKGAALNGEWRAYRGDPGSTAYSPLGQIDRTNVSTLEPAWTWKFDNFGDAAQTTTTETTPLMVDGVLYFTPEPARRCGPGGSTKAHGSTQRRARCTAASPTGRTATTGASSW